MSMVRGGDFAVLVAKVRSGCDDAAWDLVEMYGPYVLRIIRRHLSHEIRPKFDSQDFVQAVWLSFFTGDDKLRQVQCPEQLIGLLAGMAKHKIIDESRRRLETQKFSVRKERAMEESTVNIQQLKPSSDPTPSQIAMARERWNAIMADLPEKHREVVRLRMAGETYESISENVGKSTKTVQRLLQNILENLTP